MPDPSVPSIRGLKQRALRAGRWSLLGFAATQGIRLVSTLVMTRLLAPSMFGVMAIAVMVNVVASLLTDLGIRQNIVQSRRGADFAGVGHVGAAAGLVVDVGLSVRAADPDGAHLSLIHI